MEKLLFPFFSTLCKKLFDVLNEGIFFLIKAPRNPDLYRDEHATKSKEKRALQNAKKFITQCIQQEEKKKIVSIKAESPLLATRYISKNTPLNLAGSKWFILHLNDVYGKCHVCKVDNIIGENQNCPNCGRFTLNWDIEALSKT